MRRLIHGRQAGVPAEVQSLKFQIQSQLLMTGLDRFGWSSTSSGKPMEVKK
jgi:hypothetical protein